MNNSKCEKFTAEKIKQYRSNLILGPLYNSTLELIIEITASLTLTPRSKPIT